MSTKWDKSKRFVWGDRSRSKRDNNFHWAEGFYLSSSALNNRVLQSLCCDVKLHLRSNKTCINNAFKTPLASSYFSDVETVAGTFTSPVKGWKWRCVYFTRKNLLSNEVICREKNKQLLLKEIGLGQFNKKKKSSTIWTIWALEVKSINWWAAAESKGKTNRSSLQINRLIFTSGVVSSACLHTLQLSPNCFTLNVTV